MGVGRERFADLLYDSVSFGAVSGRKRETRQYGDQTPGRSGAGQRVAHDIAQLAKKIRATSETTEPLSTILDEWKKTLQERHDAAENEANVSGSWPEGGTILQNATVAQYNAGVTTLGQTKPQGAAGDERVWLVYRALGFPFLQTGNLSLLLSVTGGHHKTGKYKQSAQREHDKLLEQLTKLMHRALELEAKNQGLTRNTSAAVNAIVEQHRRSHGSNLGGGESTGRVVPRVLATSQAAKVARAKRASAKVAPAKRAPAERAASKPKTRSGVTATKPGAKKNEATKGAQKGKRRKVLVTGTSHEETVSAAEAKRRTLNKRKK